MAKRVIGIDFGNWQAFVCCVNGMDPNTRMGGTVEDLLPSTYKQAGDGIPNEFFWNEVERNGKVVSNELMGFPAAKETNVPDENHLRLLKKHLREQVTLYGDKNRKSSRTFNYDDIIVKMFEYHVKLANDALRENYGEDATTNLVSVAYPASYRDHAHLEYYIRLAEKANSGAKDKYGNELKIKVVGSVCEPAAAGLDRLNEQREAVVKDTVTYGVFDLGGGTFDLSIVALYPKGRKYPSGKTYYFDMVCEGKGLNIAGSDFSKKIANLMAAKVTEISGTELTATQKRVVQRNAERCKKDLSGRDVSDTLFLVEIDGDERDIVITRAEFEKAISDDVEKIMNFTKNFFAEHKSQMPDEIIMTGGSSYIPCIKEGLERILPEYKGKIHLHRPSKAAAYGAARFYVEEPKMAYGASTTVGTATDRPSANNVRSVVHRTLERDLGTVIISNGKRIMTTLIAAGTEIPCSSGERTFHTLENTALTDYAIYRAKKLNPDFNKVGEDYSMLIDAKLDYGRAVPVGTRTTCVLTVDALGIAHLDAWESNDVSIRVEKTFSIDNAADDSTVN